MSFKSWIDAAYVAGVHVVAACNNGAPSIRVWPAHFSSVVAVDSSPDAQENGIQRRRGSIVEFTAQGQRPRPLPWSNESKRMISGTSFSARVSHGCPETRIKPRGSFQRHYNLFRLGFRFF